ncbi:hypothetical protein [Nitrospirillum viridazoti]|uniref:Uncharacterized protein n=1 Tax=Nitrospirillum viridazoti CBAmc TaxID=1441467 RepID=A0A248K2D4_9PROT|nr:hypothetical protein [Nitrospirillum amazonense]ASG25133.1 hypothetical protein Y958_29660 [Nitrospirillum amazonense CBAmc]TWB28734.1 hypothetical protein FBZ91_12868 [Nitrospirillum amazonense]
MKANINITCGTVELENEPSLHKGLDYSAVKAAGFPIVREDDMGTGWKYLLIGPCNIDGNRAHFSLAFAQGSLEKISFSFNRKGVPIEDLVHIHNQYLSDKLGPPTMHDKGITRYVFPWGTIASSYDARGGSCSVIIAWA